MNEKNTVRKSLKYNITYFFTSIAIASIIVFCLSLFISVDSEGDFLISYFILFEIIFIIQFATLLVANCVDLVKESKEARKNQTKD